MNQALRCLALVLFVPFTLFVLAAPAAAQIPPLHSPPANGMVGESWDLLTLDGGPVAPPTEYYMEVTEDDNGDVKGQFWKKRGDNPPVKHEGAIVLHGGPLSYTWEFGEISGWMQWNPFSNSYVYYTSARGGLTRQLRQRDED